MEMVKIMPDQVKTENSIEYIRSFLREPPMILKNFHHDDILEFLNCGTLKHFVKDDVILNPSEYVTSAYLIVEGEVAVWQDNIQLAVLKKGAFMGETFLFSKNTRIAQVISVNNSTLLQFERYNILNFFRKKPKNLFNIFTRNIIQLQQHKLANMNNQLFNLKKRLLAKDEW